MSDGNSPTIEREEVNVFADDYSVKLVQGEGGIGGNYSLTGSRSFTFGDPMVVDDELGPPNTSLYNYRWNEINADITLWSGSTSVATVFDIKKNGEQVAQVSIPAGEVTVNVPISEINVNEGDVLTMFCAAVDAGVKVIFASVEAWGQINPAAMLHYRTAVNYSFKVGDKLKLVFAAQADVEYGCRFTGEADEGEETEELIFWTATHSGGGEWEEIEEIFNAGLAFDHTSIVLDFQIGANHAGTYFLDDVRLYIERPGPRCIEFFEQDYEELKDCFYVDSGLTYDGEPATEITGLIHLAGREVVVLADGEDLGNMMVEEVTNAQGNVLDGKITLEREASVVHVGLPFKTILETLDIEQPTAEGQTSQGKQQRVHKAVVRLLNSLGLYIGSGPSKLEHWPAPKAQLDTPPALQSGLKEVLFRGGWTVGARVWLETDRPYPLKVLSIIAKAATHDS